MSKSLNLELWHPNSAIIAAHFTSFPLFLYPALALSTHSPDSDSPWFVPAGHMHVEDVM